MLNKITIIKDPLDETNAEEYHSDENICDFLMGHFGDTFPETARIYFHSICEENDITPQTPEDIAKLYTMQGEFFVVHYPQGIAALVVVLVVSLAIALTYKPPIPNIALRNTQSPSPNNELAARSNTPRPNGRIPDIFGTVRSTPDLISVPYVTFENNVEVESAVMCIGRGNYEVHDAYDGETPITQIAGSSIEVYAPNIDIYSGTPYYAIGPAIAGLPLNIKKSNSINGQTLKPYNASSYVGDADIYFKSTGEIITTSGVPFTQYFTAGDIIAISGASVAFTNLDGTHSLVPNSASSFVFNDPETVIPEEWLHATSVELIAATFTNAVPTTKDLTGNYFFDHAEINTVTTQPSGTAHSALEIFLDHPELINAAWTGVVTNSYSVAPTHIKATFTGDVFNLDGTYTIATVTATKITLSSINAEWAKIPTGTSVMLSPTLSGDADVIIGPYILNDVDGDTVICNFVAASGIYKDNGKKQSSTSVTLKITITHVNASGVPTGAPTYYNHTLTGSATSRDSIGSTFKQNVGAGRVEVSVQRVTPKDTAFKGQVIDEIKWRELYHAQAMPVTNFGNVTIVRSLTRGTAGALSVKERKLNMEVTRQIPLRVSGSTFTAGNFSTNKASEILSQVVRDPKIGGRPATEVDYDNIYSTVAALNAYFGTTDATEFCYTFDKDGMTFEDTVGAIANAIFCTAYRRGSVIKLDMEIATNDSILLFNHRNKIPDSEVRTFNFGYEKNNDGVSYTWVNPEDDAIETLMLPTTSINKPKKIESLGVRNIAQATIHAYREWNKLRYQHSIVEFESIAQGELVLAGDRILVADNTRTDEQDGDIISHVGFIAGTSQKVVFESGKTYTVFLQMYDGTVQSMTATAVAGNAYAITLGAVPHLSLVTDEDSFTRTKYLLLEDTDPRKRAFLVTERTNGDSNTCRITAMNYDARYYANDLDFS